MFYFVYITIQINSNNILLRGVKATRRHRTFSIDLDLHGQLSCYIHPDSKIIENNDGFYDQYSTTEKNDGEDLIEDALEIVRRDRKCSTSYIQRKLSIGYNRAAKIVEALEEKGYVSPANHVGKRDVLIPEQN